MTYAEAAEILEGSIREYVCNSRGRFTGYVMCYMEQDALDIAIEACRMRAELVEKMKEMIKALEV